MTGGWLRHYGPRGSGRVRLLCFPYAGGTASAFRDWPRLLPAAVEPVAVQLPGRADRHAEPAYERMEPLVEGLVAALGPVLDRPYACYGVSMGARVALALAHALRAAGLPLPERLFVASSAAPVLRRPVRGWAEPDAGLVAYLRDLGGTPPRVLADPELLALFLAPLRADLTVVGTCPPPARPPLPVSVRAFVGADDTEAPPERMRPWARETTAGFELDVLPGGHFPGPAATQLMLDLIAVDLLQERVAGPH